MIAPVICDYKNGFYLSINIWSSYNWEYSCSLKGATSVRWGVYMHRVRITWHLFFLGLACMLGMTVVAYKNQNFSQYSGYFTNLVLWLVGSMFVFEFRNWRKAYEEKGS
jgi:hypothetical protein